jgi:hypothetical protein
LHLAHFLGSGKKLHGAALWNHHLLDGQSAFLQSGRGIGLITITRVR